MTFRFRSAIAGLAVAGVLAVASTAIVSAADPAAAGPAGKGICAPQALAARQNPTVETLRAFGDCEIARRFTTLDKLDARISDSKVLTSPHAAALKGTIGSTRGGLTALKAHIDAETSIPALREDIRRIATDFRVYVLLVPQVNLVSAADGVVFAETKFDTVSTRLTERIAAAQAAGKDTTAAQAHLDAMNTAVDQAVALAEPIPARLLPLTPADWNSGAAGPVLNQARADLGNARNLLRTAIAEARACREALKALG
jgi:hypothetical protein